ncbi:hypothetical protein LV779_13995 [Streptomyces thinghirensis]|nr:hypothetical protein [Streptomyces thinghirensis]
MRLVLGRIAPGLVAGAPRRRVTLYSSPDGHVPDFNEGVEYTGVPGVDRLVLNPHTEPLPDGGPPCLCGESRVRGGQTRRLTRRQAAGDDGI